MKCRHCRSKLKLELINLGSSPPSNAYLTKETLNAPEKWFPLKVLVCENCWLVQTEDFTKADELFNKDYAYFSSFSTSLLRITKNFVTESIKRFSLNENSQFIEVAANDGYLLQYVKENNIPCIGIEPTTSTANVARAKGINIIEKFFGVNLAKQLVKNDKKADFTVANNVLAHVPDINDFVSGFSIILKPNGVSTFEFTHLLKIVNNKLFDTIYHEHFSYLSLITLETIFKKNGLQIFDVEELTTQGGSLRLYAQRLDTGSREISNKVIKIRKQEIDAKINTPEFYKEFQSQTNIIKDELLNFLIKAKKDNKKVIAYGAAAKGNTLLNYAGVKPDLISYVMDKNLEKQNKFMPGSRIPIKDENYFKNDKPDFILILPWNLKDEIITQLKYIKNNGTKFVIAVPKLEVI